MTTKATVATERAISFLNAKNALYEARASRVARCVKAYGEEPYRYISGSGQEHWPASERDILRKLARAQSRAVDASYRAWMAGGRRRSAWLSLRDAMGCSTMY